LLFLERGNYLNFAGLPEWVRPTCQIIWVVSAVHVATRFLMGVAVTLPAGLRQLNSLLDRYRQWAFHRPLIKRLNDTQGLEREGLAFALHLNDNHLWTGENIEYDWITSLRKKGILSVAESNFRTVHYRIHPAAWRYMKKHPNKFIYRL